MEFYEELVHFYLTAYKGLFVLPQAAIQNDVNGRSWKADLDFISLDFTKRSIYLVEVSSSTDYPIKICERLAERNHTNIEPYVRSEILRNEVPAFTLSWWLFVRGRHVDKIKNDRLYLDYVESHGRCEVTGLQGVLDQIKEKLS